MKWPTKRSAHASTIINTILNKVVASHLIISGGLDEYYNILNDFWIIQLSSFICYKVHDTCNTLLSYILVSVLLSSKLMLIFKILVYHKYELKVLSLQF